MARTQQRQTGARLASVGEVERAVLDYVWKHGPIAAEACRMGLAVRTPMESSTIRTVLRRLEEKGFLKHTVEGRAFVYRATENRMRVAARAVRQIMDRFCGGSAVELVLGLVDDAVIEPRELERLARQIALRREGAAQGRPDKGGA